MTKKNIIIMMMHTNIFNKINNILLLNLNLKQIIHLILKIEMLFFIKLKYNNIL